jgi:hypothetical protein
LNLFSQKTPRTKRKLFAAVEKNLLSSKRTFYFSFRFFGVKFFSAYFFASIDSVWRLKIGWKKAAANVATLPSRALSEKKFVRKKV